MLKIEKHSQQTIERLTEKTKKKEFLFKCVKTMRILFCYFVDEFSYF